MPHLHSMTVFNVDRIEVAFDVACNAYAINLITDGSERTTQIHVWRESAGGERPELIVRGDISESQS
jgi:hypothetical protein